MKETHLFLHYVCLSAAQKTLCVPVTDISLPDLVKQDLVFGWSSLNLIRQGASALLSDAQPNSFTYKQQWHHSILLPSTRLPWGEGHVSHCSRRGPWHPSHLGSAPEKKSPPNCQKMHVTVTCGSLYWSTAGPHLGCALGSCHPIILLLFWAGWWFLLWLRPWTSVSRLSRLTRSFLQGRTAV